MAHKKPRELLLRAELEHRGSRIIAHTGKLSESMVFVQTDLIAKIGERIAVEFSFPGLVSPFSLDTQVIARRIPLGPVDPRGLTLGFLFYAETERRALHRLLSTADATRGGSTGRAYRVLVVEDNPFILEAFSLAVSRLGQTCQAVSVEMVSDSDAALRMLLEQDFDLAIVDYFLPTANGDRLISRLRNNPGLERLPIFAFSASGNEVRRASLDAGADLFLQKPEIVRNLFPTLAHLSAMSERLAA